MQQFKVKNESNYLAKVVTLGKPRVHSNADRLLCWNIDFNNVITDLSYKEGDVVVYFPALSVINTKILSTLNMYSDSTLNSDTSAKGYMSSNGKVKAQKLRNERSEGLVLKIDVLLGVYGLNNQIEIPASDTLFDTIGDELICWKWETEQEESENKTSTSKPGSPKLSQFLLPNQFRLYTDTAHFKYAVNLFDLNDNVVITSKLHGSSFIGANVLINKPLTRFQRFLNKWFKVEIPTTEYGLIWSSGKPKSKLPKGILGSTRFWKTSNGNYYNADIWRQTLDRITIPKGYSIYGEIVGSGVKKGYDYDVPTGEIDFYVYQITYTNPDGIRHELSWNDVKQFCCKYSLKHVPELYVGRLGNIPGLRNLKKMNSEKVLEVLSDLYLEKDLPNGLPDEGITIMKDDDKIWYKYKSFKFLNYESNQ